MKLIKKIEISRFRSIDNKVIDVEEINLFSGMNNSGKSNILRALNLFFKGETNLHQKYEYDRDYNKAFTGSYGGKRETKITVYFEPYGDGALNSEFWISKIYSYNNIITEYHSYNPDVEEKLKNDNGNIKRQFTTFFNKIQYIYVPAIRDKSFVRWLFLQFEELIKQDAVKSKGFEESFDVLSQTLQDKSAEISSDFKSFIGLPTRAVLSSKYSDILGSVTIDVETSFSIQTRRGVSDRKPVYVDLFSTGDGILMTYIAFFIAHISKKITKSYFIWGFEEPENSLEYSKVQSLATSFYNDFRKNAQIFITTHSPAFINLKDKEGVAFYRVFLSGDDRKISSEIKTLEELDVLVQKSLFKNDNEFEKLSKELYLVEQAQEIENTVKLLFKEREDFCDKKALYIKELESIKDLKPQKIFIYEDGGKDTQKLWEVLFKFADIKDVSLKSSKGCGKDDVETYIKVLQQSDRNYKPKVFRELDRDGLTDEQIQFIYQNQEVFFCSINSDYIVRFLPVNEIENFALLAKEEMLNNFLKDGNLETIAIEFEKTAIETRLCFQKKAEKISDENLKKQAEYLFGTYSDKGIQAFYKMRVFAEQDKARLYPGKDIGKHINNFSVLRIFKDSLIKNIPSELESYLQNIKDFFG